MGGVRVVDFQRRRSARRRYDHLEAGAIGERRHPVVSDSHRNQVRARGLGRRGRPAKQTSGRNARPRRRPRTQTEREDWGRLVGVRRAGRKAQQRAAIGDLVGYGRQHRRGPGRMRKRSHDQVLAISVPACRQVRRNGRRSQQIVDRFVHQRNHPSFRACRNSGTPTRVIPRPHCQSQNHLAPRGRNSGHVHAPKSHCPGIAHGLSGEGGCQCETVRAQAAVSVHVRRRIDVARHRGSVQFPNLHAVRPRVIVPGSTDGHPVRAKLVVDVHLALSERAQSQTQNCQPA